MAKVISEGQKAKALVTLRRADVNQSTYSFLHYTVRPLYEKGMLANLSEKQQTWFDSLYDKHFGMVGGNDGS